MHQTPNYRYCSYAGRAATIRAGKTANDQNTPFEEPGLTVVAFVRPADQYPLRSASARLREVRQSFRNFNTTLHLTINGVLAREQPRDLTGEMREWIEREAVEVMREEFGSMQQFAVALQGIWPGGDPKRPLGDVIALAAPASEREIRNHGASLRKKLGPRLAEIHAGLKLEPVNGVKVTLGFFDEPEGFLVDRELALVFEELSQLEVQLWVERIALVRFRHKSLQDREILHEVSLHPPADPPIRQATIKPKVLTAPHWTRWCGFSYLWDNPEESLTDAEPSRVACEIWTDPELSFYRALNDALAESGLDSTNNPYSFCPLPSTSYHATVWDGINQENLSQITEPEREKFAEFLLGLPESAVSTPANLIDRDAFAGVVGSKPVQFRFDGLTLWGDAVLVARLAPADEASSHVLAQLKDKREQLDAGFASMERPKSPKYTPHVSLGYFCHPVAAREAAIQLPQWERAFRRRTAGHQLAFRSISAYAFTSMAEFLKLKFV